MGKTNLRGAIKGNLLAAQSETMKEAKSGTPVFRFISAMAVLVRCATYGETVKRMKLETRTFDSANRIGQNNHYV